MESTSAVMGIQQYIEKIVENDRNNQFLNISSAPYLERRAGASPPTETADMGKDYEVILPRGQASMPRVLEARLALMAHLVMTGQDARVSSWSGCTFTIGPRIVRHGVEARWRVEVARSLN